jgi:hypothetical protein
MLAVMAALVAYGTAATAAAQSWPDGWIDRDRVQRVTESKRAGLYSCYARHVPAEGRKHGDIVTLRITVSEAGRVFRVDFLESSHRSDAFEKCVRETIDGLDFGSKPTKKMVYVQKLGFQNGAENLSFDLPAPAGGAITKASVEAMAKARKADLMKCYTPRLKKDPDLRGQVLVELVIDGSTGAVKSAKKVATTLNDETVESCVMGVVRTFRFAVPSDPGLVIIQFPFTFDT